MIENPKAGGLTQLNSWNSKVYPPNYIDDNHEKEKIESRRFIKVIGACTSDRKIERRKWIFSERG